MRAQHRDPTLLELDSRTADLLDELREVGLVTDEEQAAVVIDALLEQLLGIGQPESAMERLMHVRREPELTAREPGGFQRPLAWTRLDRSELDAQARERAPRRERLAAPLLGQGALGVGSAPVRLGGAVAKQPELSGHRRGKRSQSPAVLHRMQWR